MKYRTSNKSNIKNQMNQIPNEYIKIKYQIDKNQIPHEQKQMTKIKYQMKKVFKYQINIFETNGLP